MGRKQRWTFQCLPSFFGLPPNYRKSLHEDIFSLLYYGNGFTHTDIYEMPIYLRRFYINELVKTKKQEYKAQEEANKKSQIGRPY